MVSDMLLSFHISSFSIMAQCLVNLPYGIKPKNVCSPLPVLVRNNGELDGGLLKKYYYGTAS
jgi:hypothetical protein